MTLDQYQKHHNITNATMCRLLNENRLSPLDPPIYEHRLKRLKDGAAKANDRLRYMVQAATSDECCSYN